MIDNHKATKNTVYGQRCRDADEQIALAVSKTIKQMDDQHVCEVVSKENCKVGQR